MPEGGITFKTAVNNFDDEKRPLSPARAPSGFDDDSVVELNALRADVAHMRSMIEKLVANGGPPQRGAPSKSEADQAVRRLIWS